MSLFQSEPALEGRFRGAVRQKVMRPSFTFGVLETSERNRTCIMTVQISRNITLTDGGIKPAAAPHPVGVPPNR